MENGLLKENRKDYRFTLIYTISIIMVVGGHCGGGGIMLDFSGWFPYQELHLALFMFSSGYFYKDSANDNVLKYIVKKIKTLIIPLYIYNVLYGILVQILRIKGFSMGGNFTIYNIILMPLINGHQFIYNLGGWYVAPLFMIETCNVILRRSFAKLNVPEGIYFCLYVIFGLFGNYLGYKGCNQGIYLVIVRMLHFFPYFSFGTFYNRCLEKFLNRIPSLFLFLCIFAFRLFIFSTGQNIIFSPAWCNDFPKDPFLPIFIAYTGILFWLRIVTILEPIVGKNKYINLIADNTYSIMINHISFFMIIKTVFAIFSKYTATFSDFDFQRYKSDIWYFYLPKGMFQMEVIYLIAGIIGPILINLGIKKSRNIIKSFDRCG